MSQSADTVDADADADADEDVHFVVKTRGYQLCHYNVIVA